MINKVENVIKWIGPNDRVLDVGGGAVVFPRANAVIDMVPYDERQHSEQTGGMQETFSKRDWYVGDICDAAVWQNFTDKQFDFVVCSHTLEDIRDPVFVCSQLIRVAKAGYLEFPSRFREGVKGDPAFLVTGWEHHRWIIDVEDGTVSFTMKQPFFTHFDFLGNQRRGEAFDYFKQFTGVHWVGSFNYIERGQKGSSVETENMFYFYDHYDYAHPVSVYEINQVPFAGKTFEWDHILPIENVMTRDQIEQSYAARLKRDKMQQVIRFTKLVLRDWFPFLYQFKH